MFGKITVLLTVGFVGLSQAQSLFSLFSSKAETKNNQPLSMVKSLIQDNMKSQESLSSKSWTQDTNEVFRLCDSNKSGFLTKQEFISCGGNE